MTTTPDSEMVGRVIATWDAMMKGKWTPDVHSVIHVGNQMRALLTPDRSGMVEERGE